MNFNKLLLFFKSRNYREMFFLHVKLSIKNWIMKPFMYIKAIYETIKLNRDYPSSWDRYVKLKEIEHNTELKQKNQAKATAYTKFVGAISRFDICILSYSSSGNNAEKDDYEIQFDAAKKDVEACIKELEKLDVVIPDELKTIIMTTNVDSHTDLDEYNDFHTNLHTICDKIKVTY